MLFRDWMNVKTNETFKIDIHCTKDLLKECCQKPYWYYFQTSSSKLPKNYQIIQGVYDVKAKNNSIFQYEQMEAKDHQFIDEFKTKLDPMPIIIQQEFLKSVPIWVMKRRNLDETYDTVATAQNQEQSASPCIPLTGWHISHTVGTHLIGRTVLPRLVRPRTIKVKRYFQCSY